MYCSPVHGEKYTTWWMILQGCLPDNSAKGKMLPKPQDR
jgi:hypothetical protein